MIHSKTTTTGLDSVVEPETSIQNEALAASQRSPSTRFSELLVSTLHHVLRCFQHVFCASWLNVTFVLIPAGILAKYLADSSLLVFIFNAVAIIPSSHLLTMAVEDLSFHLDGLAGGITTVVLRNAGLLVIFVILITSQQDRTLASLFYGSLPANLLLGPGLQFVVGGIQWHVQDFAIGLVQTMNSCLFIGIFGLSMVTLGNVFRDMHLEDLVVLLRGVSFVSLACYAAYLLFRLRTHADLFVDSNLQRRISPTNNEDNSEHRVYFPNVTSASGGVILCTAMLAISTQLATDQILECVQTSDVSDFFIGFVVLPIAINNPFSLLTRRQNSVDAYLVITLDRTVQLVLMYTPIFWLFIWTFDEDSSFRVEAFATIVLLLSAFVFSRVMSTGRANWFTGFVMVVVYIAISIGAFFV